MGSDGLTRDVWDLEADEFPANGSTEQQVHFLLRYAILAPSSHNSQPWRFTVDDHRIGVSADETRWLEVADPDKRELHLSLGCAIENLRIAADHFDFECEIEYQDATGSDPIAVVTLHPDAEPSRAGPPGLFDEITNRYTSHELFDDRSPPPSTRETLQQCVLEDDVSLYLIDDPDRKREIGELQATADQLQMDDPAYRSELGHWVGIGALGSSWLAARIAQTVVTHFDLGGRESRTNSKLVRNAPLLGLLVTTADDPPARIRAGQVFERLALAASAAGVATHPLSQILERPKKRTELAALTGIEYGVPQHLFRLGYTDETPDHTPRWPLERFLSR